MVDDDFQKIGVVVADKINKALEIALEPVTEKLDALWDQTAKVTEDLNGVKAGLTEVKETVEKLEFRVDTIDRKIDRLLDDSLEHKSRLDDIEALPSIAHELKLKKKAI